MSCIFSQDKNQNLYFKKTTIQFSLVILAGGLGSRYHGQKQIDAIGPNKECLMEYSIYDAMSVGISHFVFVINQYFEDSTRKYFQRIIEKKGASVEFVLQTTYTGVPRNYFDEIIYRKKPWGTGHALLVAKNHLSNPFIVINADDFYGRNAFVHAKTFYDNLELAANRYGIVTYQVQNTLSENGGVSRGICKITHKILKGVEEYTNIFRYEDKVIFEENNISGSIDPETPVSMNFWILHPSIFKVLEDKFEFFIRHFAKDEKAEFYLPQVINDLINENKVEVTAVSSNDQWFGMTYPGDKEIVKELITKKIAEGAYPRTLWI